MAVEGNVANSYRFCVIIVKGLGVLLGPLLFFWPFYGFHTGHCLVCSVKANKVSFTLLVRFDLAFWVCSFFFFFFTLFLQKIEIWEKTQKRVFTAILGSFLGLEF